MTAAGLLVCSGCSTFDRSISGQGCSPALRLIITPSLCTEYEIYGQVFKCRDHKTGEMCALKVIRNQKRFHKQALVEIKILEHLRNQVTLLHTGLLFCSACVALFRWPATHSSVLLLCHAALMLRGNTETDCCSLHAFLTLQGSHPSCNRLSNCFVSHAHLMQARQACSGACLHDNCCSIAFMRIPHRSFCVHLCALSSCMYHGSHVCSPGGGELVVQV